LSANDGTYASSAYGSIGHRGALHPQLDEQAAPTKAADVQWA